MLDHNSSTTLVSSTLVVVLVLVGLAGVVFVHASKVGQSVRSMMDIVVELDRDVSKDDINTLTNTLSANERIKLGSVQYVSKEEALKSMHSELGDIDLGENPFSDVITFNLESSFYNADVLSILESTISSMPGVSGVYYQSDIGSSVATVLRRLSTVILVLSLIIGIAAYMLIRNMLRLQLEQDRQKIETMQMVGASDRFVLKPYLKRGIGIAIRTSLIAVMLLFMGLVALYLTVEVSASMISWGRVVVVTSGLIILTVLTVFYITLTTVTSYLQRSYLAIA